MKQILLFISSCLLLCSCSSGCTCVYLTKPYTDESGFHNVKLETEYPYMPDTTFVNCEQLGELRKSYDKNYLGCFND